MLKIVEMEMPKEIGETVTIYPDGKIVKFLGYGKVKAVGEIRGDLVECGKCKYDGHCVHQSFVPKNGRHTFYCADGEPKREKQCPIQNG